ncbi:Spermidine/putrescine ABC transporter substrate-binding protein / putative lipoprotein MG045 [[Mycoplasma] cavipharyngis]|uniref:hypothetical protein n=1 Tax=[Mycoplasma] cavipharyngis TaxID=92757 RepID=UPI003703DC75
MQKTHLRKLKLMAIGLSATFSSIFTSACFNGVKNSNNTLVFGNYQSYMSPWLQQHLSSNYDVNFDSFNTSEEVPPRYQLDNYDASVVSASVLENLIKLKLTKKINWSLFNLEVDGKKITTATEALSLFTKPVQKILSEIYTDENGMKINLLDYGIPYFLQTFNFAYRGQVNKNLNPDVSSNNSNGKISWSQTLEAIAKDPRFKSNTFGPQIGIINDPRTLLSVANIIDPNDDNVNPKTNALVSDLENKYYNFDQFGINKKNLGNNPVLLNSDSNVILNKLAATPKTKGSIAGGFMYNGDILFASNGGDNESEVSADDLHIVKNDKTLYALDLINFSNKVSDDLTTNSKLDRLYKIARKISLEGVDQQSFLTESEVSTLTDEQKIAAEKAISNNCNDKTCKTYDANLITDDVDNGSHYVYGPMINFNYVQYTPVLTKMYNQILGVNAETVKKHSTNNPMAVINTQTEDNTQTQQLPLDKNDDLTFDQVKDFVEDSYFYQPPTKVYFGFGSQIDNPTNSEEKITTFNDIRLSYFNFDDGSSSNQTTLSDQNQPTRKLVIKNARLYDQKTEINNTNSVLSPRVEVTYEIQATANDEVIESNIVDYSYSHTAKSNFEVDKKVAVDKALLQEKIIMINAVADMNKYVERSLADSVRSNMLIAFLKLKQSW